MCGQLECSETIELLQLPRHEESPPPTLFISVADPSDEYCEWFRGQKMLLIIIISDMWR